MIAELQPLQKLPSAVEIDQRFVLEERLRRKTAREGVVFNTVTASVATFAGAANLIAGDERIAAACSLVAAAAGGLAVKNTRFGERLLFRLGRSNELFIDKAQGRKKRKLEAQCQRLLQQDDFNVAAFTEKLIGLVGGNKHGLGTSTEGKLVHSPDNSVLSIHDWKVNPPIGTFSEMDGVTEFSVYHGEITKRDDGYWYYDSMNGWYGEEYLRIGGMYEKPTLSIFATGDDNEKNIYTSKRLEMINRDSAITGKSEELAYDDEDHQYITERTLAPQEVRQFCQSLLRAHLQS